MRCAHVMKTDVEFVSPETTIADAARRMRSTNVGFLAVCDQSMRAVGALTDRDIVVRAVADSLGPETRVGDILTNEVIACHPEDHIEDARELMARHQKGRIMCIGDSGRVEGVISLSDLVEIDEEEGAEALRHVSARERRLGGSGWALSTSSGRSAARTAARSSAPLATLALGAAVGAATAYLMDSASGAERRARMREQLSRASRYSQDYLNRTRERASGAWSNRSWGRGDQQGVQVQKSIEVNAEPHDVYACWRNLEQLPRFMSHVRDVRRLDDARYHWVVDGPAGTKVEWDADVIADTPNELLAWRTVEGSTVHSSGTVQFEPAGDGRTRVHVRMSYRPPASAVGHAVAKVFARDPHRQIEGDLMRFKQFIESDRGAATGGASAIAH